MEIREKAVRGQAILVERLGPQYALARYEPALVPPFMRFHSLPTQFQSLDPENLIVRVCLQLVVKRLHCTMYLCTVF